MKMAMKWAALAALAALLAWGAGPPRAEAGQIIQVHAIDGLAADGGTLAPIFAQFAPASGTLTGVEIRVNLTGPGESTTLGNHANQPKGFTYSVGQAVDVDGPGLALTFRESESVGGLLGPRGQGTFSAGPVTLGGPASPTDLAGFLGGGTFHLSLSTGQQFSLGGGPAFLVSRDPGALGGAIELIYDYEASTSHTLSTPEPSSLVLTGTGVLPLLGLIRLLRRGRRPTTAT